MEEQILLLPEAVQTTVSLVMEVGSRRACYGGRIFSTEWDTADPDWIDAGHAGACLRQGVPYRLNRLRRAAHYSCIPVQVSGYWVM